MTNVPESALDDPRWQTFNAQGYDCSCGQHHVGLFPINMQVPKGWPGEPVYQPESELSYDGNFLSQDLCVIEGKYFAMRMRLPLSIRGAVPHAFMYTVWASLNRHDFEAYLDAEKKKMLNSKARAPARLVNNISGFDNSGGLMGVAFQQEDGGYPLLLIHGPQPENDPNHAMIGEQRNGISVDRMFDLFAEYGHDMRPAAGGAAG